MLFSFDMNSNADNVSNSINKTSFQGYKALQSLVRRIINRDLKDAKTHLFATRGLNLLTFLMSQNRGNGILQPRFVQTCCSKTYFIFREGQKRGEKPDTTYGEAGIKPEL